MGYVSKFVDEELFLEEGQAVRILTGGMILAAAAIVLIATFILLRDHRMKKAAAAQETRSEGALPFYSMRQFVVVRNDLSSAGKAANEIKSRLHSPLNMNSNFCYVYILFISISNDIVLRIFRAIIRNFSRY